MPTTIRICLIVAIAVALLWAVARIFLYFGCRTIARRLVDQRRRLFPGPHEFAPVVLTDYAHVDVAHYDATRDWLAGQGFRHLGDLEDVTVTNAAIAPAFPLRFMTDSDSVIVACVYAMQTQRIEPDGQRARLVAHQLRMIDFDSLLTDGTRVETSTMSDAAKMEANPARLRYFEPPDSSPEDLLARHREHVAVALRARPGVGLRAIRTLDELIESARASHRQDAEFHRQRGWVSREEIERIASALPNGARLAARIATHVERLSRQ